MSSYFFSQHTYACISDQRLVLLDLARDKYLCVNEKQTALIAPLLTDCAAPPSGGSHTSQISAGRNPSTLLQNLLAADLVTQDRYRGKALTVTKHQRPSLAIDRLSARAKPSFLDVVRFLYAAARASHQLHSWPILRTVLSVSNRRKTSAKPTATFDERTLALAAVFLQIRPILPRPYLCTFDSLCMLHFLAQYGVFAQWTFGVKMAPFYAHCWVEFGEFVLNDDLALVHGFTPILVA